MSPSAAVHNPIFREYLAIVAVLLLGAGLVLATLQFGFRMKLGNVWQTWQSWLWMAPLAALAIFSGRVLFILGVMVVALLAFREFARASSLKSDRAMCAAVAAGIGGVGIAALLRAESFTAPLFGIMLVALGPIVRNRSNELQCFSLGVIAFVYLGWMFGQLGFIADSPSASGYLCFLLFATGVCDVAGFTFGKIFGRHPLRSGISPGKTLEGSLGALLVGLILPWLLRFSFPFFGTRELILAGLIVGLGGQMGDLSLSFLKREFGIKDWGAAIPGHGGILDRIDSLIFVAPLFILLVNHYHPGR
jgi:phosphatidate cytidylyltransferase